ncbi:MAG: SIR2 family protein [Saprospiraceae bacterium]|nr:SIR2 family protein [Saprospiraceae bacterium]
MPKELPIKEFIDVFAPQIKAKECVLFLGPRFGQTREGKSVSETIRTYLREQNFLNDANAANGDTHAAILHNLLKSAGIDADQLPAQDKPLKDFAAALDTALREAEKAPNTPLAKLLRAAGISYSDSLIDEEFENLFLLKQRDSFKEVTLKSKLSSCLKSMEPGPLYEAVARLPFKAVISCTADSMLEKAFTNLGKKNSCEFRWYSSKNPDAKREETIPKNKTILYNLFGNAEDPESLIVNYESFFKFFVSLFNNKNPMPKDLQMVLDEAKLFMLLGFDMSKWYFPFIVSKLNLEKNSFNTFNTDNFSILTQDSVFHHNTEFKMNTTFIVLQSQTETALSQLQEAVGDSDQAPAPRPADEPWRSDFLAAIEAQLNKGELAEAIEALLNEKQRLDLSEEIANNLTTLRGNLASTMTAFTKGQITHPELLRTQSITSDGILAVLSALKNAGKAPNN